MDYLAAMRLLVSSAELGSFSRAADAFNVKASSVSRQISNLEKDLGVALFRRSTRSIGLTDAGMVFYDRAVAILNDMDETRRMTVSTAGEPSGTFRLRAPAEFGVAHIAPLVSEFMMSVPGISFDLVLSEENLDSGSSQYDMTIQMGAPVDSRSFAQKLARNNHVVCCAPSYLERSTEPKFPSDLRDHNCLMQTGTESWRFGSKRSTVEVSVIVAGNYRSNQLGPIVPHVLSGAGFARLPYWLVGPHIQSGALVPVLRTYEVIADDSVIYGVYPERRSASPKLNAFLDFLIKKLGTPPYWEPS